MNNHFIYLNILLKICIENGLTEVEFVLIYIREYMRILLLLIYTNPKRLKALICPLVEETAASHSGCRLFKKQALQHAVEQSAFCCIVKDHIPS